MQSWLCLLQEAASPLQMYFRNLIPLTWCTEIDFWVTCTEEDRDRETEAQVLKWEARDLSKLIISVGNAAIHKANAEIIVMTQR